MTLPNFLIIGAQKSGTTWLAWNLGQHPDVFLPDHEIHYFDKDYNFERGIEWYKEHFVVVKNEQAIGEKTPDYLWANGCGVEGHLPYVHKNIHNALPEARLIVVFRNPVARAISAVNHIIRTGRISPLHNINELLGGKKQGLVEGHGVIDKGRYFKQIQAYYEYFDRSRILILFYEEDIVSSPALGLTRVCQFLGVDSSFDFQNTNRRVNKFNNSRLALVIRYYLPFMEPLAQRLDQRLPTTKARPSQSTIHKLYKLYEEDNEQLFDLLGRRVVSWQTNAH